MVTVHCLFQIEPGKPTKDLTTAYDPEEKPIKKIVIVFKPEDDQKDIVIQEVIKLKVCAHPSE